MPRSYIFSSESVGEGHPDKVCDTISDAILDACLAIDPTSRVACETYAKSNVVIVGGEITVPKLGNKSLESAINIGKIVRDAIREIGYVNGDDVFHADQVFINNIITSQSADIAQGVDAKKADGKKTAEQGAGDQGLMFGYACNETPELMPAPIMFAHRLGRELTRLRKTGVAKWLRPDAKSQVSVEYVDGKPTRIVNVVISTQHAEGISHKEIEKFCIEKVIRKVLPAKMLTKQTEFLINPTGRFVIGGPRETPALRDARSSSTPTVEWAATEEAPSPARIRPKSTVPPLTWAVTSPRTSWPPVSPTAARSSSLMRSVIRIPSPSISTPSAPPRCPRKRSRSR